MLLNCSPYNATPRVFQRLLRALVGPKFARILLVKSDLPLSAIGIIGCCTAHAQTYGISTFAGGAPPTAVPATSTSASEPQAVAVDAVGDVFFADFYSNIMRVDAVTGQLTVVVGISTPGFSGDDGLATNAQLNQPAGIAVDLAGNLYIADTLNNRIRRVSHGVIATIAGDGTTAVMNMPLGIAVDVSGNVYVADSGNNRVLEISQGSIATVATLSPTIGCAGVAVSPNGTLYVSTSVNVYQMNDGLLVRVSQSPPPAKFQPVGIAVDANGRVYVADVGNHEIWQISNGTMTVVAGNGTSGYSGDNGPATLAELNGARMGSGRRGGQSLHRRLHEQPHPQSDVRRNHHHRRREWDDRPSEQRQAHDKRPVESAARHRDRCSRQRLYC